jgi:hypothetical protein
MFFRREESTSWSLELTVGHLVGMVSLCLWRRHVEEMMSQHIDVLKFRLRLMKLSQIRLYQGT